MRAVAAVVGLRYAEPETDDDSVDVTLAARGAGAVHGSAKLDLQLKCLLGNPPSTPKFNYKLKKKNYADMIDTHVHVPRILVVVVAPENPSLWFSQSRSAMTLQHSAWWLSLRGLPPKANKHTVTVKLDQKQRFDPVELQAIMLRIKAGGVP